MSFKKKSVKETLSQEEGISINLEELKKNPNNEEETESFESFMKRELSEKQKEIDGRKKSRTPTKLKSASSKKKKWGQTEEEENSQNSNLVGPNFRKTVSVDDKEKQKVSELLELEKEEKPGLIKFLKLRK